MCIAALMEELDRFVVDLPSGSDLLEVIRRLANNRNISSGEICKECGANVWMGLVEAVAGQV